MSILDVESFMSLIDPDVFTFPNNMFLYMLKLFSENIFS